MKHILVGVIALLVAGVVFSLLAGSATDALLGLDPSRDSPALRANAEYAGKTGAGLLAIFFAWVWVYGWRLSRSTAARAFVLLMSAGLFASVWFWLLVGAAHRPAIDFNGVTQTTTGFPARAASILEAFSPWIPIASLGVSTIGTIGSLAISVANLRRKP